METNQTELRTADSGVPPIQAGATTAGNFAIESLPPDALILISTRNLVLFPGTVLPLTMGRQRSVAAAQAAIRLNRPVGLVLQRDPTQDDQMPVDLHLCGTEAMLLR